LDIFGSIFGFFGSLFGYVLKFFFDIFMNYGVAIFFFTVFVKLVLLPFSITQQKTQAKNARLSGKLKEIRDKYATDRQKQNEETQKLYSKEGVNPASGCLTSLIQFPILLGLYYAVIRPLSNVLHLGDELVTRAVETLKTIPGFLTHSTYPELDVLKYFEPLKGILDLNPAQTDVISKYSGGFSFLGLDLFGKPEFTNILIVIPILCFITSAGSTLLMQRMNGNMQQPGGGKLMMIGLSVFSAYIAFTVPAAVGLYWIFSNLIGLAQTFLLNRFYGPNTLNAKTEAQRLALRDIEEAKILSAAGYPEPVFIPLGTGDVFTARNSAQQKEWKQQPKKKKRK